MRMCLVICPGEKCLRRMSLLLLCLPLKGRMQLYECVSFCMSCVEGAGVNLRHLFLEGNPRYLGRQRHHPFPKRYNSVSSNGSSFPQKLKMASRKEEFFDDQSKYLSCITARGTVSVPLQRGSGPLLQCVAPLRCRSGPLLQCAVPPRYRSGPPLQCAAPPRYRFGTARALYYNARCRHPVCVLQSFNSVGVMNFQENTKTNAKPRNATLTL